MSRQPVGNRPLPLALGKTGSVGEGHGESGSTLMKEKSGNLLTSVSATLSGEDEGT